MRGIADTIARLSSAAVRSEYRPTGRSAHLASLEDFGSNPGNLAAYSYVPATLSGHAPLIVVLHGCTQTASGYDTGSGWSTLADECGFVLLFPEQQRVNNPNGCFNWFEPGDTRRGVGEALSIRQMIAAVEARFDVDPERIFITGLSAGGAMTSTMLATYPEVFAGGAIIAGLPHGVASGVVEAFDRMRGHALPSEKALVARVCEASSHTGPWPTVAVWHGSADPTVSVANAEAIAQQWGSLHLVGGEPNRTHSVAGASHSEWLDPDGRVVLERFIIAGMGHAVPLQTTGPEACGSIAPYMVDVGISSTRRIAQSWGIIAVPKVRPADADASGNENIAAHLPVERTATRTLHGIRMDTGDRSSRASGVTKVIEDALRAAGLMK